MQRAERNLNAEEKKKLDETEDLLDVEMREPRYIHEISSPAAYLCLYQP